jgi:cyclopropane fatty-acyl-phospholipid synthase-like methyltransferase
MVLNKLVENCLENSNPEKIVSNIRNECYDYHCHNTHKFYKYVLQHRIQDNSKILEVGIGGGRCVEMNSKLIKSKNLRITGIDIDKDYIEKCNEIIKREKLQHYVSAKYQNLLDMDETKKYDAIFFMESYPVIPEKLMIQMMKKCKKLLTENGQVIFVHNLEKTKCPIREFMKPKLKYIPFLWVDFGRLSSHDDFDNFMRKSKYTILKKKLIENVSFLDHYFGNLSYSSLFSKNDLFKMNQYFISCRPI